jgi:hypothetical protein
MIQITPKQRRISGDRSLMGRGSVSYRKQWNSMPSRAERVSKRFLAEIRKTVKHLTSKLHLLRIRAPGARPADETYWANKLKWSRCRRGARSKTTPGSG